MFDTMRWLLLFSVLLHLASAGNVEELRRFLVSPDRYPKNHRPVRDESKKMDVDVFVDISHVESINEKEQTMTIYGRMAASWKDEYLTWNSADYNNTSSIELSPFVVWLPAFALYNAARGNYWNIDFHENPVVVSNTGDVYVAGTYTFQVTCFFDFTAWPFDTQKCPVIVTDWVYNYAQIHLKNPLNKPPSLRLSYDPFSGDQKRHVGGWEITDTWRSGCLWGPTGCEKNMTNKIESSYWSLLEFGVQFKRHIPYFGATLFLPMFLTSIILLTSFWIDTFQVSLGVLVFNSLIQGIYGYEMISKMPPGSGGVPKIVQIYSMNLLLTAFTFIIVVFEKFIIDNLPSDYTFKIGFDITELPKKAHLDKLFETKGFSFDPQSLYEPHKSDMDILENGGINSTSIGSSDVFTSEETENDVVVLEDDPHALVAINLPDNSSPPPAPSPQPTKDVPSEFGKLQQQLHVIKRATFCVIAVIYFATIVYLILL